MTRLVPIEDTAAHKHDEHDATHDLGDVLVDAEVDSDKPVATNGAVAEVVGESSHAETEAVESDSASVAIEVTESNVIEGDAAGARQAPKSGG